MNRYDFTQAGGFPLDQEVLALLQDNSSLAAKSALLGGDFIILSGCDIVGPNAANGVVVINGEILPFVGAAITAKVIIHEDVNPLHYEDGNDKGVEYIRYATFGDDGVTNYLWANFKRNTPSNGLLARVERLEKMLAPLMPFDMAGTPVHGCRLEWNKPAIYIPAGWVEDDDAELQGRFPVGYKEGDPDFGVIAATGGAKTKNIGTNNLPPHSHGPGTSIFRGHRTNDQSGGVQTVATAPANGDAPLTAGQFTASVGGGEALSVLNPFRVVKWIKWVG